MKLSMENSGLRDRFGDERAIRMICEAGFDGIDYSYYWLSEKMRAKVLGENYVQYAKDIKKLLDELDMKAVQAHAPFELKNTMPFHMGNVYYKEIVRSMESAAIMGVENIVVHAITPENRADFLEYNYRFYKSLEPYCARFGIHIAIENLFVGKFDREKMSYSRDCFGRADDLIKILDMLDSKWFVICVDVGHANVTGNEAGAFIRNFNNRQLRALHIHDNDSTYDAHLLPCFGNIDWESVTGALADIDYRADFTLEIISYIKAFGDDTVKDALTLAEKVGRSLIQKIEMKRK